MQTYSDPAAARSPRLAAVRRLYVYFMAFASLLTALIGFAGLVDTLSRYWLGASDPGLAVSEVRLLSGYELSEVLRDLGSR